MIRRYRHFQEIALGVACFMLLLFSIYPATGQEKFHLQISGLGSAYKSKAYEVDSSQIEIETKRISKTLRVKGYWLAELQELRLTQDTAYLDYFLGRKFDQIIVNMKTDSGDSTLNLSKSESNLSRDLEDLNRLIDSHLRLYEDNGYPFAQVKTDSARIIADQLHLNLEIDPGIFISFDTIKIVPEGVLSKAFLSNYLGMRYSKPYSEKAVTDIPNRLSELNFLKLKNLQVTYQLKQAQVAVELQKIPTNYFDGILGMVPSQGGGVEFTGELNLSLQNLFKSAKALEIHWEKLRPESQKLNASYLHPLLFKSPLDLYLAYDQIKQDTAFSNRSIHVAFEYRPRPKLKMKVRYENKLGNQLSADFDEGGDFNIDYYGMGISYLGLDDHNNPTNGLFGNVDIGLGQKEINSIDALPNSTQYDLTSQLKIYKRISTKSVLHFEASGGLLMNDYLYLNDLYRLGGLQTIRGFNEGEFFASRYFMSRLEWRILLDEKSFLLAFYDQAFLDYKIVSGSLSEKPSGIGVGMQMQIKGGNFQIIYGLGKRDGESFSFDSSKIHFGYRALF